MGLASRGCPGPGARPGVTGTAVGSVSPPGKCRRHVGQALWRGCEEEEVGFRPSVHAGPQSTHTPLTEEGG